MSVSKRAMKVAVVFVLLAVLALPASAAPAVPQAPRLIFSHFQCDGTDVAELHFVLQDGGSALAGTFVQWHATLDGDPISGIAPYTGTTGGAAHYAVNVPVEPGDHVFVILATTSIALPGGTVYMFNPQTVELGACAPLFNQIDRFEVTCAPTGARLEWDMLSEVGVYEYALTHDMQIIARIPAQCPGCMIGASYVYTYTANAPNGEYGLFPTNGGALTYLAGCTVAHPTAVRLSRFSAK